MGIEWRALVRTLPLSAPVARLRCITSRASIACSNPWMETINDTPNIEAMQLFAIGLCQHRWAKRPRQQRRRRRLAGQLQAGVDYNVIAFPAAAGVFYPFTLSPKIASVSMSGSFAVVAINALMLQRGKLADIKTPRSPGPPVAVANVAAGASA